MISKSHKDIQSAIDSIPYGTVRLEVKRVNRHTVEIAAYESETLKYTDTEAALGDVLRLLRNLSETGHSGEAHIQCTYKEGNIILVAIQNEKKTQY